MVERQLPINDWRIRRWRLRLKTAQMEGSTFNPHTEDVSRPNLSQLVSVPEEELIIIYQRQIANGQHNQG